MRYGRAFSMTLLGVLAAILGCNSMQTSSAILRFQQGEYDMADSLAREALKVNPNDGEAYFYMALSQSKLQNYKDAYANFKKAAELKPDRALLAQQNIESNFAAVFNEGVEAFQLENTEMAIEAFETATEANPENPLGYTNLAKAYWAKAERVKEFDAESYNEYATMTLDNLKIGLEKEADPGKREETANLMANVLGNLYVDATTPEAREGYLTQYRQFTLALPDLFSPHESFANVLFEKGAFFQEKRRQKETYLDYFLYAGEAFSKAADVRERLGQQDVDVARLTGIAFLNAEKYAEAANYLMKAVNLDPNMEDAWYYLEYARFQSKDYQGAIEAGKFLNEQIRTTNPEVFLILYRTYRDLALAADDRGDQEGFRQNKALYEDAYVTYATYKGEPDTTPPVLNSKAEQEKQKRIESAIYQKDNILVLEARVDGRFVRGKLINRSGAAIDYVELTIDLLDPDDEVLGSTFAEISSLAPDQETSFSAAFMTQGVAGCEIKELFWE